MTRFIRYRRRTIIGMASILVALACAALRASAALITPILGSAQSSAFPGGQTVANTRPSGIFGDLGA